MESPTIMASDNTTKEEVMVRASTAKPCKSKKGESIVLSEFEATLAMQLLRSVDERIAAAARRIFSNVTTAPQHDVSNLAMNSASVATPSPISSVSEKVMSEIEKCNASTEVNSVSQAADSPIVGDKKDSDSQRGVSDRLQRSRERNRIHARRTRQRKKEHMQNLQNRIDILRSEQMKLKQTINEKNTANILLVMCGNAQDSKCDNELKSHDSEVDLLLQRSTEEIPAVPKTNVLPALILPRQGRKGRGLSCENLELGKPPSLEDQGNDDINYKLLAKDRSTCTPDELDKIRRERNRMHAKRTRDRKRILMEEMEAIIDRLEHENDKLRRHASDLKCDKDVPEDVPNPLVAAAASLQKLNPDASPETGQRKRKAIDNNQLQSLLAAATVFHHPTTANGEEIPQASTVTSGTNSTSMNNSISVDESEVMIDCEEIKCAKRQCVGIPRAITTKSIPESKT